MSRRSVETRLDRKIADASARKARRALKTLLSTNESLHFVIQLGNLSWDVTTTASALKYGNASLKTLPSEDTDLVVDRQIDLSHPPITQEAVDLLNAIAALAVPRR